MCNPIVIVGSFNQDLTWYCGDFPKPGETSVGRFATGPGGKGSNQAVAAARTGIPTTFVGAIGNDVFGDAVRRFYEAEGINHQLVVYPDTPTGNAGIFGSSTFSVVLAQYPLLRRRNLSTYFERYYRNV